MTKILLITFSLFAFLAVNAQINYTNYEETWLITMDAAEAIDLDNNGVIDFYVNNQEGKLGFYPVNFSGCMQSVSETAYNNIGTREVAILEEGNLVKMTNSNMFDYIDENPTAIYDDTQGYAEGWSNLTDQYIGFGILEGGFVYNGWMKVAIYEQAKAIYIKEIAFVKNVIDEGGIIVGDKGLTNVPSLDQVLSQVEIFPNPAVNDIQLKYNYQETDELNITIQNNAGQKINHLVGATGINTLNISLDDVSAGLYFVRFESQKGVHTEKLMVTK